jgi:hypothetical protein
MRGRLWLEGWSDEVKRIRALYVGTMYSLETAGRASGFTHCEQGGKDHRARNDDFTFVVETSVGTKNVVGSGLACRKSREYAVDKKNDR